MTSSAVRKHAMRAPERWMHPVEFSIPLAPFIDLLGGGWRSHNQVLSTQNFRDRVDMSADIDVTKELLTVESGRRVRAPILPPSNRFKATIAVPCFVVELNPPAGGICDPPGGGANLCVAQIRSICGQLRVALDATGEVSSYPSHHGRPAGRQLTGASLASERRHGAQPATTVSIG